MTFESRLTTNGVAAAWESCTSTKTYSGLAPASYVFSARATDKAGNVSSVVTESWTVAAPPPPDTTAPVVSVTPVGTLSSTASFTLAADEDNVTFDCRLTTNGVAAAWESCTSTKTYSGLAPASYVFSARATDKAGNVSTVITRSWTTTSAVGFQYAGTSVAENVGTRYLTVTRTNPERATSVRYARTAGTARPQVDFVLTSGTLTFAAGQASRAIPVRIIDDATRESAETIVVTLSSPQAGAVLGSRTSTTLTITASDQRPDAMIRGAAATHFVGNNVYNTTGSGQSTTVTAQPGRIRGFYVRIYNDGSVRNTFVIKGSAALSRSTVYYLVGRTNVTKAMRSAAGYSVSLAPGAYVQILARVVLDQHAVVGTSKSATVSATWRGDGVRTDVVKGVVRVVR